MGTGCIKLLTGLWDLRRRKDVRNKKILRVQEPEIAGDSVEMRAPLILVFLIVLNSATRPAK
jgi:hypothetical protein